MVSYIKRFIYKDTEIIAYKNALFVQNYENSLFFKADDPQSYLNNYRLPNFIDFEYKNKRSNSIFATNKVLIKSYNSKSYTVNVNGFIVLCNKRHLHRCLAPKQWGLTPKYLLEVHDGNYFLHMSYASGNLITSVRCY